MPDDDVALVQQLRREWINTVHEGIEIRDKKGYVDSECRSKMDRIDLDLNKKMDALIAAQDAKHAAAEAKMNSLMQRSSRPPGGDGGLWMPPATLGQRIVESDEFKACSFQGKFTIQMTIKSRIWGESKSTAPVAHPQGGGASAGGTGISPMAMAPGTIVSGGTIQIVPPVGAYPIFPMRMGIVPQMFPPTVMRDLVPVIPIDGTNAVEYVRENWTMAADYQIQEGDVKAMGTVTYTDYIAPVRTIAWYVKISRQMAMDVPFLMATIEQRLRLGVLLKEDREILYGDNSAGHLWGIMPQATPSSEYYAAPPATGTAIDQLNAAETYIESQFYVPTAIVMNPVDMAVLESMKTTFGTYLLGWGFQGPPAGDGIPRLWGLPIVTTPVMNRGDYLVGAFPGNCALFDRETVNVEIAFQNEDDFIRNLITIRAEERVAFAVFVPKAFACGPFTAPPLDNPAIQPGMLHNIPSPATPAAAPLAAAPSAAEARPRGKG